MTSSGDIPHFKPNGKKVYFSREALERWITGKTLETNPEVGPITVRQDGSSCNHSGQATLRFAEHTAPKCYPSKKTEIENRLSAETMFKIDFFELCFLAEACIPPVPIARSTFWMDLIETHFHKMSDKQKKQMFEWMKRTGKLDMDNIDCKLFCNRFDPENQYRVFFKSEDDPVETFLHEGHYHTASNRYCDPDQILRVEPISPISQ